MSQPPLWSPDTARIERSHLHEFMRRYAGECSDYSALHAWSIAEPAEFWRAVAEYCGLKLSVPASRIVIDYDRMPGARWFIDAELNYAENLLQGDPDRLAIIFCSEDGKRIELTLAELRSRVAAIAAALRQFGVARGDRVAGILPNSTEAVIAALATASLGAIWSSCSPDFGSASLIDRLRQLEPKVLFGVDGYSYAGKPFDCREKIELLARELGSVNQLVLSRYLQTEASARQTGAIFDFASLSEQTAELEFAQVGFDDPLFIMFSSGTTGKPKCIVHGVGGTLLQHLKEHQLHTDIHAGDRVFYYTTTGWMMWNWLLSTLASGATLVLYDGAPLTPKADVLWQLADRERIKVFGTSARYLSALEKAEYLPADYSDLQQLDTILSTGSPLAPSSFDFVYRGIKTDVQLASISGGTDLISCFVLGNPMLPVYRGEIQCVGLGMDVRIVDDEGHAVTRGKGELVCGAPFPSMPVGFWNDPSGSMYRSAYFERFPGLWHHGDFAEFTQHGGIVMHGRSDSTLNPGGIRIGTSEIYRILEALPEIVDAVAVGQEFAGDTRIILFVVPASPAALDGNLESRIKRAIRDGASPHHVPSKIIAVADVPRTLNGKTSERAVSDAIHGRTIANLSALANPDAIEEFKDRWELRN